GVTSQEFADSRNKDVALRLQAADLVLRPLGVTLKLRLLERLSSHVQQLRRVKGAQDVCRHTSLRFLLGDGCRSGPMRKRARAEMMNEQVTAASQHKPR